MLPIVTDNGLVMIESVERRGMIPPELLERYNEDLQGLSIELGIPIDKATDLAEQSLRSAATRTAEMHTATWATVGNERWLFLPENLEPAARIETEHGTVLLYAPVTMADDGRSPKLQRAVTETLNRWVERQGHTRKERT